ncbi:MAG: formate/nitrite transporter family protein [Clostridium sp.]
MNLFTSKEVIENFAAVGVKKSEMPAWKMILLGILAGAFIAFGCVATNTSAHSLTDVSSIRTISGLLFPGGISLVILMGAELFTGNCLMTISVLDKKITLVRMLKNWIFVYIGNFIGSVIVAYGCAAFGQMNYSGGGLAVYTMKLAIGKSTLPFANAVVLGFFCNVLVCLAVLCSLAAKDVIGRIMGTFLPVAFFVICGFEHCVANMYYIPAGIFASHVPAYAAKAVEAGLDLSMLTWGNFVTVNLLPVTIGNILGGGLVGAILWVCHVYQGQAKK